MYHLQKLVKTDEKMIQLTEFTLVEKTSNIRNKTYNNRYDTFNTYLQFMPRYIVNV